MRQIYLITGNAHKLRELQAIFPSSLGLKAKALDITEIQSLDSSEILKDKLQRVYDIVQAPVIAEDVTAELACLNGLPGPFTKFFNQKLGRGALWQLAEHADNKALTVTCFMGYYDGKTTRIVEGNVQGKVVPPRGENGFGFDFVLVPDGHDRTFAEMSPEEKNKISARFLAAKKLVEVLTR